MNEVNKMHTIYEIAQESIEPFKEALLNSLRDKINSLPKIVRCIIESQITKIFNENSKKFLDSSFGKPLKAALEKFGLSKTALIYFINKLYKERKKRRKKEREELKIDKNEFLEENNNLNFDLFEFIEKEYNNDNFKDIIKEEINKQLSKANIQATDENSLLLIN